MKVIYLILALGLGGSFIACAQDIPQNDVPSVVVNAFHSNYPNALDVEWERKGELFYVEYEIAKTDHEAWLDASGKIVKHEEELAKNALPEVVRKTLEQEFKSYRIDDVDKVDKGGATYYRIELDGNLGDRTIVLDATGKQVDDAGILYE